MKLLMQKELFTISGGVCERKDENNFIIFNCQGLDDYSKEITQAMDTMIAERKSMNINWTENKEPFNIRLSWWWCLNKDNPKW